VLCLRYHHDFGSTSPNFHTNTNTIKLANSYSNTNFDSLADSNTHRNSHSYANSNPDSNTKRDCHSHTNFDSLANSYAHERNIRCDGRADLAYFFAELSSLDTCSSGR
jgi:hypothetical protein